MSIVISDRYVKKTKKRHICCICYKYIEIGSNCYRQTNIYEGDFCCVYWHYNCSLDRELEDW